MVWIGIIVSVVAAMALGFFWYSPAGFGNAWIRLNGWSKKEVEAGRKKGMGWTPLWAALSTAVWAGALAYFLVPYTTLLAAYHVALIVWLGFVATTQLSPVLWEGKPLRLFLINTAYSLVGALVAATILFYLH